MPQGVIMGSLSVELNSFDVGSHKFDCQQILPIHKKRLESSLSTYFLNRKDIRPLSSSEAGIPFHLKLEPGSPALFVNGEGTPLGKSTELREIERVVRYYQHVKLLPRVGMTPEDVIIKETATKDSIRATRDASVPGTNGQVIAGARIAEDSLSLIRNIMFAIPTIGTNNPTVTHLGYYAGTFWMFFSLRELKGGWHDYQRAVEIGDDEGRRRAEARILSGGIVSTATVSYLTGRVCDSLGLASASATALGAASILFGVGSVLSMGTSAVSAVRCYRFNERLNEYLENPHLNEAQRLEGALRFLKDALIITPEEKIALEKRIEKEHPEWSVEERADGLKKKLTDLAETKVKYLKRRTSNKSIQLIFEKSDPLLAKLAHESTRAEGVKEASELVATVKRENRKKMILFLLAFLASTLCFIAMIATTVFSAGLAPFIIYTIAGAISLGLGIYTLGGMWTQSYPAIEDSNSIQDLGPLEPHHMTI